MGRFIDILCSLFISSYNLLLLGYNFTVKRSKKVLKLQKLQVVYKVVIFLPSCYSSRCLDGERYKITHQYSQCWNENVLHLKAEISWGSKPYLDLNSVWCNHRGFRYLGYGGKFVYGANISYQYVNHYSKHLTSSYMYDLRHDCMYVSYFLLKL